ncbi:bifunctional metallophosphatase/5'-nucleotidase [Candidatus Leptofilum sp.]|uniref:bifunctional metallophosphatase/5'-nucleotidase n=1 Tax=Candidatus Leptofilum sp. TaxID=3241576 RepID=UPI003B5CA912
MKPYKRLILVMMGVIGLVVIGCRQTAVSTPTTTPTEETVAEPALEETGDAIREITILYTNDEHGRMAGLQAGASAANLMGLWRTAEAYQPDGNFLLLSGGDMWTGPAISTWFQGQSMAEVMNAMGYDAAAVGNHEFDFGLEALQARAAESDFPFLSANIRYKSDGTTPEDLGIRPYTIVTVNDIQVGVIGLTTTQTPTTTNPVNITEFDFLAYETALREVVPQVRETGAEMIVVPGHICQTSLEILAQNVSDLGIALLGGGHCNELFASEVNDIVLLEGGTAFAGYAYATFQFDIENDEVVSVDYGVRSNSGGAADPEVEAIVMRWQEEADAELNRTIGYSEGGLLRRSQGMQSLITEAWLWAYPTADVAITNLGGMRADLPPGDITLADVVGVMPFENVIVELLLTGEQLEVMLGQDSAAVGGVYRESFRWHLKATGEELDPDAFYTVLVNDFMYAGGDDYALLSVYDPDGYNTAINWRQPVIDWIMAQASSPDAPIDDAFAALVGE